MTALLEVDEAVDRVIDLFRRHVALIAILNLAVGLECHGGVHETNLRESDERRAAREFRIDEFFPGIDRATDNVRANAQRISVVQHRMVGDPLGRTRIDKIPGVLTGGVTHLARILAVAIPCVRPNLACLFVEANHLIPFRQLGGVPSLEFAGRPHGPHQHVRRLEQISRRRLIDATRHDIRNLSRRLLHLERQGIICHRFQLRHVGHSHAQRSHGDVILRPNGRKTANCRPSGQASHGGCTFEHAATAQTCFFLAVCIFTHIHTPRLSSA